MVEGVLQLCWPGRWTQLWEGWPGWLLQLPGYTVHCSEPDGTATRAGIMGQPIGTHGGRGCCQTTGTVHLQGGVIGTPSHLDTLNYYGLLCGKRVLPECQNHIWIELILAAMHPILIWQLCYQWYDEETGIFWDNYVNTMSADDLAPGITRTSATMALKMQYKPVLVLHRAGFQLFVLSQYGEILEKCKCRKCIMFPKINSTWQRLIKMLSQGATIYWKNHV